MPDEFTDRPKFQLPQSVPEPAVNPEELVSRPTPAAPEPPSDDLSDLFEGPQPTDNDMTIDHLVNTDEEEDDLSDLVEVSDEDIMGDEPILGDEADVLEPKPPQTARPRPMRFRRTGKPAPSPTLGGLRDHI